MEPVGEAPIGLYIKFRKTRTFEMDVMQKILIWKLSNLAHAIFTNGCLYQYHSISVIWATTNKTMLFYPGCVNMQKYDHIMDRSSNKMGLLHDTFQIGIKLVVFASNHGKFGLEHCKADDFSKYISNNML